MRLFQAAGKPLTLEVVIESSEGEEGIKHHPITAVAIHDNVTCDECGQSPIVGARFKCCVREDFDLCAACEGKQQQPFAMIKIDNPQQAPAALIVGLRDDPPATQPQPAAGGRPGRAHGHGPFHGPRGPWGGPRGFHHHPPPPPAPGADGFPLHPFAPRGFGGFGGFGGAWRGCAPAMAHPHPEHLPLAPLQARFVKDETLPDGSAVPLNTTVEKVWVVRNDGISEWPAGVKLVYVSGDEMAVELPNDIRCSPGQEVRLVASLKAPPMTGRFVSYFRLHGPAGHPFGQRLWCDVRSVEQVPAQEPHPAAATASAPAVAPAAAPAAAEGDYVRVDGTEVPAFASATATPAPAGAGPFEREMAVLRELGFANDSSQLGGLLQDLLGPVSAPSSTPDERVAGLQRVISTLLHASGHASAAATPSA